MGEFKYIVIAIVVVYYIYNFITNLNKKTTATPNTETVEDLFEKMKSNTQNTKTKNKTKDSKKDVTKINYEKDADQSQNLDPNSFKEYKPLVEKNEFAEKLKNPQSVRDAVIMSELLNNKYL